MKRSLSILVWIWIFAHVVVHEGIAATEDFLAMENTSLSDFSPDGSQFLMADFVSGELWRFHFSRQKPQKLASLQRSGDQQQSIRVFNPRWSPDGSTITFASFDANMAEPITAQIWKIKADGSGFLPLSPFALPQYQDPLSIANMISFFPDGRGLLFMDAGKRVEEQSLISMGINGENRNKFIWQDGLLGSEWSPDQTSLAYFVQKDLTKGDDPMLDDPSQMTANTSSPAQHELWLTSIDGGQLRKTAANIYVPDPLLTLPIGWSPNNRHLSFFTEQIDEKMQTYRELQLQPTKQSTMQVLLKTWGYPQGSIKWARNGVWLAYMESEGPGYPGTGAQKLVTVQLKKKGGKLHRRGQVNKLPVTNGSIFLGWDPDATKYYYLLRAQNNKRANSFALVRKRHGKDKEETILPHLPPQLVYHFDERRRRIVLCGQESGCHLVTTPAGSVTSLTPNFSTMTGSGDFYLSMGEYDSANEKYKSIDARTLERNRWIQIMTRRYVVSKRSGDVDRQERLKTLITSRINKGEAKAQERLLWGQTLAELEELDESIAVYKTVIDKFNESPEARDALFASGFVYREQENFDFAKNCFANFARFYPEDERATRSLVELGETYLMKNEPGKAIKIFRKVTNVAEKEDRRLEGYLGKARALEKMNRFQEAIRTYHLILDRQNDTALADHVHYKRARLALSRLEHR